MAAVSTRALVGLAAQISAMPARSLIQRSANPSSREPTVPAQCPGLSCKAADQIFAHAESPGGFVSFNP